MIPQLKAASPNAAQTGSPPAGIPPGTRSHGPGGLACLDASSLLGLLARAPMFFLFLETSGEISSLGGHRPAGLDGAEPLLGRRLSEIVPASVPERAELLAAFDQALRGQEVSCGVSLGQTSYAASFIPLAEGEGRPPGGVCLILDLSSRVAAWREAETALRQAAEAQAVKGQFLANMSHEIRTPLAGIMGMAELLATTPLSPEQRRYLGMIQDSSRLLLDIVTDILDLSRLENRRGAGQATTFDLHCLARATLERHAARARGKNLAVELIIAPGVPVWTAGEPELLAKALDQLLANAVKFTQSGAVVLRLSPGEAGSERSEVRFSVIDTGIGIPGDKISGIFAPFTQLDSSMSKKYQGTGLGLAIFREIMEQLGGSYRVESPADGGSAFHFSLRLAPASPPEVAGAGAKPMQLSEPPSLRILLAEDHPINNRAYQLLLSRAGHEVTAVTNGREALEALRRKPFDVVLMDIQMPEMDGLEATRRLRSADSGVLDPAVPVIALTAYAMKGDEERFLRAGMDAYVAKPVTMAVLNDVLNRTVSAARLDRRPRG